MKIKKIKNILSKSVIRPEAQKVYIEDNVIMATDFFRAVKIEGYTLDNKNPVYLTKEDVSKEIQLVEDDRITFSDGSYRDPRQDHEKFPDVKSLFPSDSDLEGFQKIKLNYQYLIDSLEVMKEQNLGQNKFNKVSLYFQGEGKPLILKSDNTTSLISPMRKDNE